MARPSAAEVTRTVMELCCQRLPAAYGYTHLDGIQVLCAGRKGEIGTAEINRRLQEELKCGDLCEYLNRLKSVFEFKTVCYAGFMPSLDVCEVCGTTKDLEYFDVVAGCVVCKNFYERYNGEPVKVSSTVLKLLSFMENADYKSVFAYNGSVADVRTISEISEKYMINAMEIFPSALTYLKTMLSTS